MCCQLVCFDLDDTLLLDIHSVMFLCLLAGKGTELAEIEAEEAAERFSWIEADHHKAALLRNLPVNEIPRRFHQLTTPIGHIPSVMAELHARGIQTLLITAGPLQVAEYARKAWGIDACFGSDYEVKQGRFTGRITRHLGDTGKLDALQAYCAGRSISLASCIAVGDGGSDLPLFAHCGGSIALNAAPGIAAQTRWAVNTHDLRDILPHLV